MTEENFFLVLGVGDGAEFVGHAKPRHHGARHARRLFDVADRTGGDLVVAKGHFLGDAAAEGNAQI